MSMNVQSTLSAYGNYQNGYNAGNVKEKKETQKSQGAEKAAKESFVSNAEKQLSKSAQNMLNTLRSSRSDMDFMVADFDRGDNAKEILSHSNKEFTVIFSSEELEKMAANPKYYAEKMHSIEGAIRMSEEINAKYGFERAFGKNEVTTNAATITKFGISFNSDGSTTLFAELEKSSAKQKEWLEKTQEQKAEDKKAAKKKEQSKINDTKKTTVQASSLEELMEKVDKINWDTVKADTKTVGGRFDFTV